MFYPRMFWRVLIHPGEVALYTRRERGKDLEHRFSDAISPVLMLILSVAIACLPPSSSDLQQGGDHSRT